MGAVSSYKQIDADGYFLIVAFWGLTANIAVWVLSVVRTSLGIQRQLSATTQSHPLGFMEFSLDSSLGLGFKSPHSPTNTHTTHTNLSKRNWGRKMDP